MTMMLIGAALLALATSAQAADSGSKYDPRATFAQADTNRDGFVDHGEFHVRIVEIFFNADGNKDGFLDPEELKKLAFPEDFTDDDKDKNGRVSMREFMRVRLYDFEVTDTDHDGELSLDEVVVAYEGKKRS